MTYHLHIGVAPTRLLYAMRAVRAAGDVADTYIDGDGWEAWGEAVGTDVNDDRTLHVIVEVADRAASDALVAGLRHAGVLTPMLLHVDAPTDAVLTDVADWTQIDGREGDGVQYRTRS